jgi:hypothetical protein
MHCCNVRKSSNLRGAPVVKLETTPQQNCIALSFGWFAARLKGLYGIPDPTIERIQQMFAFWDFAFLECGWSLAQISCLQNTSALAKSPRLFKLAAFFQGILAEL